MSVQTANQVLVNRLRSYGFEVESCDFIRGECHWALRAPKELSRDDAAVFVRLVMDEMLVAAH